MFWKVLKRGKYNLISLISEMLSYPFMVKAIFVGLLISVSSALLGITLVLKRYSMIGVGLSNVSFAALSIAISFDISPIEFSMPIVIIAGVILLKYSEKYKISSDTAIALLSCVSVSVGVTFTAITKGLNVDVCNYLFGSILIMKRSDMYISFVLGIVVLISYILLYNKIYTITIDEDFAKASGINVNLYNTLVTILISVTIVIGMKFMGSMLISCLIIFPAMTSMRLFKSYRTVVVSSVIISAIALFIGITLSYIYSTPTGASIVLVNLVLFILAVVVGRFTHE